MRDFGRTLTPALALFIAENSVLLPPAYVCRALNLPARGAKEGLEKLEPVGFTVNPDLKSKTKVYRLDDLLRVLLPLAAMDRASTEPGEEGEDDDRLNPLLMTPNNRRNHWAAEKIRQELRVRAGELIERGRYERELSRALKVVGRYLDIVPDVLERDCGLMPQQVARVEREMDKLRQDMHAALQAADDDDVEGEDFQQDEVVV